MSSQTIRGNDPAKPSYSGQSATTPGSYPQQASTSTGREASVSGVAWPSIFGGAFAAAASTVVLLELGAGIGLTTISPWNYNNLTTAFTIGAVIWVMLAQWVSAGLGGYLTGRLRTKWVGMHTREVFFRDTAHGFLTWAVATMLTAYVLAYSAATVANAGMQPAMPSGTSAADPTDYYVDALFRSSKPILPVPADVRAETKRILLRDMSNNQFLASDKAYLSRLIAWQAGITPVEASRRVDYVVNDLTSGADTVRRTSEGVLLASALAMIVGAVIACYAAAYGGRHRDSYGV